MGKMLRDNTCSSTNLPRCSWCSYLTEYYSNTDKIMLFILCIFLQSLFIIFFDMYLSYGWGSTGENVTSERHTRALHEVTSERYTTW